jgi:hypothetical protein
MLSKQNRDTICSNKIKVSLIIIVLLILIYFGLTKNSLLVYAETNNYKDRIIKNFSFEYKKYGGRIYPGEISISYSSENKELIYFDSLHYKYYKRTLNNIEENALKQTILNNGFFKIKNDYRINCCNLINTSLNVTMNNITKIVLWNIDTPNQLTQISYGINHLIKDLKPISNYSINMYKNKTNLEIKNNYTIKDANITNFFFNYSLIHKNKLDKYDRISYNSKTKELQINCNAHILIEELCGPDKLGKSHVRLLNNIEENALKQTILNNGFFFSNELKNIKCSDCYIETLTVKLNDKIKTVSWNIIPGLMIPYPIADTMRIIYYIAGK